jgi:hypothetical protein
MSTGNETVFTRKESGGSRGMDVVRNVYNILGKKSQGRDYLEIVCVDDRTILNWISEK